VRGLDGAVLDPEFVEPERPLLEFVSVGHAERDVVESNAELAERLIGASWSGADAVR
jgi:hypothetical protein